MTTELLNCASCGAPLTESRCRYCGAEYISEMPEGEPAEQLESENRNAEDNSSVDMPHNATRFERPLVSPVSVFFSNIGWGILVVVLYEFFSTLLFALIAPGSNNFFSSPMKSPSGIARTALLLLFMPSWAAYLRVKINNKKKNIRNGRSA